MGKLKFAIISLLFLVLGLNLNAQDNDYEAGQWHFGPHIGANFGSYKGTNNQGDLFWGYDIGAYGGYCFTNLIGVNVSVLYGYENWMETKTEFLKLPALFLLQFGSSHLGLGFQYNHALTKLDGLQYLSYNNHYLSGIMEFGFFSSMFSLSAGGITGGGNSYIRSLIRVGYAITPRTYTEVGEMVAGVRAPNQKYEYNPYFFELAIQYNIGQHFNDKKTTRTRTRR